MYLMVQVISGYQLPKKKGDKKKSILDPYVKVEISGVAADNCTQKTDYVHNNGTPLCYFSFDRFNIH